MLFLLGVCLLIASPAVSIAKYAGYDSANAYLSWTKAQDIYKSLNSTETTQSTPHGGYTQTSVKCVVCHSVHRATTNLTAPGIAADNALLSSSASSCVACHAAWGSSPASRLVEVGENSVGPHTYEGSSTCAYSMCHGSVHGTGPTPKYQVTKLYNLTNALEKDNPLYNLESQMDAAIAAGNTNSLIGTDKVGQEMKAYATGYVCYPCHKSANASRSVAQVGYNSGTPTVVNTGHASATASISGCDSCHDMVGVSTGSSAWPHGNRGIEVYRGRYNGLISQVSTTTIKPDDTDATRYGLWMTSGNFGENELANPLVGKVADTAADWVTETTDPSVAQQNIQNMLTDGACIKCHNPETLR